MHVITLAGSEHQKSRLRNGHKVRVKHGEGFNVVVSPNTYHLVSRAFVKNKGTSMQLSPEEIAMNKSPSPEMQRQIMGHNDHLILPNPAGALVKGSGIGDWFKNVGNQIKGAYETVKDKVYTPIENAIVNPIKNAYEQNVPESIRKDISTGAKIMSPQYLLTDAIGKVRAGQNPVEIFNQYREDLKHLNATKNKIIKSSPVLTEAYKKGVMTTAGLGSAALGTTLGLNPVTGALLGAAGAEGGRQLLKAEGYGLLHAINHGIKHHYNELKHHAKPIGGALNFGHIKDFFKNAGHAISNTVRAAVPVAKKGAQQVHNFLLNNPALAAKVKEHGSKLAGLLAKMGANYLSGDEKYGEQAESMGSKLADEQIHKNLGYGIGSDIESGGRQGIDRIKNLFGHGIGSDIDSGIMKGVNGLKGLVGEGLHTPVLAQLMHAINKGAQHHYHELKHHSKPIGGALTLGHIKNFFTNAGKHIHNAVKASVPVVKKTASNVHNFLLNNPALAAKVKEHGSKLAGMLAKMGANYLSGDEKYGDQAESMGSKLADEQIHKNLGYGLYSGAPSSGNGLGTGLYAGKMRGTGPFHSFHTLQNAADAYANANSALADMNKLVIHNQHTQRPIQKYYDGDNAPPSRGTGINPHTAHHIHQSDHLHHRGHTTNSHDTNLIRGRGTLIEHNAHLPPALVSQPYGANFQMQFMLPPQYQKYNDGTYTY
jgi:hypothetical protein